MKHSDTEGIGLSARANGKSTITCCHKTSAQPLGRSHGKRDLRARHSNLRAAALLIYRAEAVAEEKSRSPTDKDQCVANYALIESTDLWADGMTASIALYSTAREADPDMERPAKYPLPQAFSVFMMSTLKKISV